jgi:hypothetical protein
MGTHRHKVRALADNWQLDPLLYPALPWTLYYAFSLGCLLHTYQDSLSQTPEQFRQTSFQALRKLSDVHQRDVPYSALNAAVVGSMQPAALRSLFLIDLQFLTYAPHSTAKPNSDIERHCKQSSRLAADTYTPDESHYCA